MSPAVRVKKIRKEEEKNATSKADGEIQNICSTRQNQLQQRDTLHGKQNLRDGWTRWCLLVIPLLTRLGRRLRSARPFLAT